jgi:hypothetical protein
MAPMRAPCRRHLLRIESFDTTAFRTAAVANRYPNGEGVEIAALYSPKATLSGTDAKAGTALFKSAAFNSAAAARRGGPGP